ncbi:MAG: lipocalin family protein [Pseudoxanthomonas suwonensis]|nr:lipocalin family protein [Pseudoxanthomonas suwonensis]
MDQRLSRVIALLATVLLAGWLSACASRGASPADAATVHADPIDLQAFMGTWHVVARIPNMIERGHMGGRMDYALQSPERVDITYSYRTGPREDWRQMRLAGQVQAGSGGRDWRVRFFRLVPTTQRILEIDPDGQWALLNSPGRELAWIFARTPELDETLYRELRDRLRGHGVDTDKVWRVVHTPEQVGQRGFDQPNRP